MLAAQGFIENNHLYIINKHCRNKRSQLILGMT